MTDTTAIEAASFQRLRAHPDGARTDERDLARRLQARFGPERLADRCGERCGARGGPLDRGQHARKFACAMPFARCKAHHRRETMPRPMRVFEAAQARHG